MFGRTLCPGGRLGKPPATFTKGVQTSGHHFPLEQRKPSPGTFGLPAENNRGSSHSLTSTPYLRQQVGTLLCPKTPPASCAGREAHSKNPPTSCSKKNTVSGSACKPISQSGTCSHGMPITVRLHALIPITLPPLATLKSRPSGCNKGPLNRGRGRCSPVIATQNRRDTKSNTNPKVTTGERDCSQRGLPIVTDGGSTHSAALSREESLTPSLPEETPAIAAMMVPTAGEMPQVALQ